MNLPDETIVRRNVAASRYEIDHGGLQSVAEYLIRGDQMIFTHTFVPPELRGKGVAEKLVRAGLADARAEGFKVVPACTYVVRFIESHAEYRDLLT